MSLEGFDRELERLAVIAGEGVRQVEEARSRCSAPTGGYLGGELARLRLLEDDLDRVLDELDLLVAILRISKAGRPALALAAALLARSHGRSTQWRAELVEATEAHLL